MGRRKAALMFSVALLVISILSVAVRGLEFGIDFTGGTLIEIGYPESVDLTVVRASLDTGGFKGAIVPALRDQQRCFDQNCSPRGGE